MKFILILVAHVSGNTFVSPGWYYPTMQECKQKAAEVVIRSQPTRTFYLEPMCFEVHGENSK